MNVVLELREFPSPHTGAAIVQIVKDVMEKWGLSSKASYMVTDNASNMVKAFKLIRSQAIEEAESLENKEKGVQPEEDEEFGFDEDEDDDDSTCDDSYVASSTSTFGAACAEGSTEENDLTNEEIDSEASDFFADESNSDFAVKDYVGLHRIGCFSHTLQLVVTSFDKHRNQKGNKEIGKAIQSAKKFAAKFNSSSIATPKLIKLSGGRKLIKDVATRWSSTYLLVKRLLDLRIYIDQICQECKFDSLTITEWATLEKIVHLLKPFAHYTQLLSGDKFVTLSAVVPAIAELKLHLETVSLILI